MTRINKMDDAQENAFRVNILQRLKALDEEDSRGQDSQSIVSLDQQAVGRLSRQDALLSQSMAKATQARRSAQRTSLKAALKRLDNHDFGNCEDCGDNIHLKRLEFDPTVTRCISCASG
jgi:DnaK suppressor protein